VPKKRLSKSSLLWFIRSRSYVSIPDIRRRFNLDDREEVSPFVSAQGRIYVGLPSDATRALGDLVREGRIGLELQPGLMAKVAVGVYVMPQARERFPHPVHDFDGIAPADDEAAEDDEAFPPAFG
jgi:hypothetical protein